jgi:dTDP-4-amino-4,6-dideoxy-D-galactose acyltransferase
LEREIKKMQVKRLAWDSQFFGVRVGELKLDDLARFNRNGLNKKSQFDLVYLYSPMRIKGVELMDERIVYQKGILAQGHASVEEIDLAKESDFDRLLDLAIQSSHESRFRKDSRIADAKVDELYELWLKKSLSKQLADEVFFIRGLDKAQAFVTVKFKKAIADIGLIAVDEACRGQGLGRKLMDKVYNECVKNGTKQLELVTQASNVGACQFYQALGFEIKTRIYVYHLWLN